MSEPPTVQGGWWQLLDIRKYAEEEFEWWANTPPFACPNDGEPLTNSPPADSGRDAEKFCRFCGWQRSEEHTFELQ